MDIKVGDILANIRKAVDDDIDSLSLPSTGSQARGTLMRGVLREMRVNMSADGNTQSVREEIETLRDRIKRKGEAASLLTALPVSKEDPATPSTPPALVKPERPEARGAFSGIMTGEPTPPPHYLNRRSPSAPANPPQLRPSLAEEDHFSGDYQESYNAGQDTTHWPEQDAYYGEEQQPAYDAHSHYHDRAQQEPQYPLVPHSLMSAQTEAATETAFRHLTESILARATGDRGLEDMTREILRTHIKQWLDANLPSIVEDLVREEIERVARKGR